MSPLPVLQVVGAAIVHEGRCLAARRGPQMKSPGKWEFPGGKIEPGETPEAALARELIEELSLEIHVETLLGRGRAQIRERIIELDVYGCRLAGEFAPVLTEHAELRWVDAHELHLLDWLAADWPVLGEVRGWMVR